MDAEYSYLIAYEAANKRTAEALDVAERYERLYDAKCVECDLLREKMAELRAEVNGLKASIYDRFQREDA
jgi:hypothetical protein